MSSSTKLRRRDKPPIRARSTNGASKPRTPRPRGWWIWIAGSLLCVVGLGVSAYVTFLEYTSVAAIACPDTGIINCEKVLTSSYAHIFGVPTSDFGLIFFAVMLPLQSRWAWNWDWWVVRWARLGWCLVGIGSVFWLLFAELYRLDVICIYCTGVHIVTFAVLALTAWAMSAGLPEPSAQAEQPEPAPAG